MNRFNGQRVLITGASSGIGLATAERMAREGAQVALIARGADALEHAAERARRRGAVVHVVPADVADRSAAIRAVEGAVTRLGGLDVVVSNAAATAFGHFLETDADDFDRTIAICFTGPVNVIRAALPHLRASRGTVVATSSMMARVPLPAFSAYAAAKHALRGFLATLAIEEREQRSGVRIAMVSPGPVNTPIYRRATSGTGSEPATLAFASAPEVLADAIAQATAHPRHDRLVGPIARLGAAAYALARPVFTPVLIFIDRYYRTGETPAAGRGALWEPLDGPPEQVSLPRRRETIRRILRLRGRLTRPVPERSGQTAGVQTR